MLCYRIVTSSHAPEPLSGEGARLYGGRWSPPGWRCVYTAESRALAVLEMLVHLNGRTRGLPFTLLTIRLPDGFRITTAHPPESWDAIPAGDASQSFGGSWLKGGDTIALRVPSIIIPDETNLLLNPQASGFERVEIVDRREFQMDRRLVPQS